MKDFFDAWLYLSAENRKGSFINGYIAGAYLTPKFPNNPTYLYGYQLGQMHKEERRKNK